MQETLIEHLSYRWWFIKSSCTLCLDFQDHSGQKFRKLRSLSPAEEHVDQHGSRSSIRCMDQWFELHPTTSLLANQKRSRRFTAIRRASSRVLSTKMSCYDPSNFYSRLIARTLSSGRTCALQHQQFTNSSKKEEVHQSSFLRPASSGV